MHRPIQRIERGGEPGDHASAASRRSLRRLRGSLSRRSGCCCDSRQCRATPAMPRRGRGPRSTALRAAMRGVGIADSGCLNGKQRNRIGASKATRPPAANSGRRVGYGSPPESLTALQRSSAATPPARRGPGDQRCGFSAVHLLAQGHRNGQRSSRNCGLETATPRGAGSQPRTPCPCAAPANLGR